MRTGENIYKRKDGRWEARSPIGYNANEKIRYKYLYGSTYREVKEKKQNFEKWYIPEYNENIDDKERKPITFGEAAELWLNSFVSEWKPSTYSKYKSCLSKYLSPMWKECVVTAITQEDYDHLLLEMAEKKQSCTTLNMVLRGIQKYLSDKGLPNFTFSLSTAKTFTPKNKQMDPLLDAEWNRLTRYAIDHLDGTTLGILLCMYEGIRIGELCSLRWKDVDFIKQALHIQETVQRLQNKDSMLETPKTYLNFGTPKNGNERWIPIHPFLLPILKEESQHRVPNDFILSGSTKIIEPRTFTNRFHKILGICSIRKINVHLLRHSFASRCAEAGMDIKALSEILGHRTIKMTMDRYVHLSLQYKQNQLGTLSFSNHKNRQNKRQAR